MAKGERRESDPVTVRPARKPRLARLIEAVHSKASVPSLNNHTKDCSCSHMASIHQESPFLALYTLLLDLRINSKLEIKIVVNSVQLLAGDADGFVMQLCFRA
jgi:hypothetical protein